MAYWRRCRYFPAPQNGGETMPVSKAQQKAVNKYVKENYDRVLVTMPKGQRATIKAHAEARGESVNGFIGRAIDEAMERDKAASSEPVEGPSLHTREQKLRRIFAKKGMHLKKPRKGGGYLVEGDGERSFNTFEELEAFAEKL